MDVEKQVIRPGTGPKPSPGQTVTVHFTGFGKGGDLSQKFWSTKGEGQKPFSFQIGKGAVIKGLRDRLQKSSGQVSEMNLSPFKRDIDELIDEFVENHIEHSHHVEKLGKFRDLVVEAKDKGVEIAAAVAKQMLDKNMFIYGAVDEASATKKVNQLTELQNARVRLAYDKLNSETEIQQFVHLDMGKEVDLNSLHKLSVEYADAKKRAIKGAGEILEIEDIKHISEEKELMGDRVEKLKEEWESQRLSFSAQTKLDGLATTQKLLKDVEHNDEDDEFDELDRLLFQI